MKRMVKRVFQFSILVLAVLVILAFVGCNLFTPASPSRNSVVEIKETKKTDEVFDTETLEEIEGNIEIENSDSITGLPLPNFQGKSIFVSGIP